MEGHYLSKNSIESLFPLLIFRFYSREDAEAQINVLCDFASLRAKLYSAFLIKDQNLVGNHLGDILFVAVLVLVIAVD